MIINFLGVLRGTSFTQTDRINLKRNDFGIAYSSTEIPKPKIPKKKWFCFGITPKKSKPIYHIKNNLKYNIPKLLTNNTKNTNSKIIQNT